MANLNNVLPLGDEARSNLNKFMVTTPILCSTNSPSVF